MATAAMRPEDLRFDPPSLPPDDLVRITRESFGVAGTAQPLRGERDQNLLIRTGSGAAFVLKVASPSEDPTMVDFQCAALEHIAATDPTLPVPRLVRTGDGERFVMVTIAGAALPMRLLTYLPGVTFDLAGPLSLSGLDGIGSFQARLALALDGFGHPAARHFMPWALDGGLLAREELWSGLPAASRAFAEPCRARVVAAAARLATLRRQVVHHDGHRGNLLRATVDAERIVGVIDFGDLVEAALVGELGISGASFLGAQPDPIAGLGALVAGFDSRIRLTDEEIEVLPELVLSRLALSTLLVEYQVANTPHIAAAVAAELPGLRRDLGRWSAFDPRQVAAQLHDHLRAGR